MFSYLANNLLSLIVQRECKLYILILKVIFTLYSFVLETDKIMMSK